MTTATRLLDTILEPDQTSAFEQAFRRIDIAEQEIASAIRSYPLLETQINGSFSALCPTEPLSRLGDKVFRHHCRELLDRVVSGADLRPGTDAELLAVLAEASLVAPPDRSATHLYWTLFERLFPGKAAGLRSEIGELHTDAYDKLRAKELEESLRRKLSHKRTP